MKRFSLVFLCAFAACAGTPDWTHFNKDGADVYFRVTAKEGDIITFDQKTAPGNISVDGQSYDQATAVFEGGRLDCANAQYQGFLTMTAYAEDGKLVKTQSADPSEERRWFGTDLDRDREICALAGLTMK